jgi:hypothetical protein
VCVARHGRGAVYNDHFNEFDVNDDVAIVAHDNHFTIHAHDDRAPIAKLDHLVDRTQFIDDLDHKWPRSCDDDPLRSREGRTGQSSALFGAGSWTGAQDVMNLVGNSTMSYCATAASTCLHGG